MTAPYRRFLASTDVEVWSACLDELDHAAESADDERLPLVLADGLCVAIYLRWLAHESGNTSRMKRADEQLDRLRARVLDAGPHDGPAWRRCRALVLVNDGYPILARALIGDDGIPTPELAVLLVRGDDVQRLVGLRGYVRAQPRTTFLPAAYDYADALVNVGGLREAQEVLTSGGWAEDEPLLIDLLGGIHERLGEWAAAYEAYRRSPWPNHRFRAAVVGTIAGHQTSLEVDESIREVLLRGQVELDQAGMARSLAFINACLWQQVESWILEQELGRLCFRRRQFAEADVHLSRALLTAPPAALYPIAELRSVNLTWLTPESAQRALSLLPEALAAGAESLRLGGASDSTAEVRLWMAEETRDRGVLPTSIAGWPAHQRARAYSIVDAPARALDTLLEALETRFNHRPIGALIRDLHEAGLAHAVAHLADVILREADNDFFALWETCRTLQALGATDRADDSSATAGNGEDEPVQLADRFIVRLLELSQLDFMNAMRTCEVVLFAGFDDLAEELLLRAAKHAEGVSELLAVAVQRRDIPRSVHSDQEARLCLARARDIARDRLERLEIARELFAYGALREGRAILQEEGVFSARTPLSHSEMVVALQCAPWCTEQERTDIAVRAAQRLSHDEANGLLGPYPELFGERLNKVVTVSAPTTAATMRAHLKTRLVSSLTDRPWSGEAADGWSEARSKLDELLYDGSDADTDELTVYLDELRATGSFGLRLLAVKHLRGELSTRQQEVRDVLPTVPPQETPVAQWYADLEGARVIRLCDLWKARILESDDTNLREFLAQERQYAESWERRRDEERAPIRRQIVLNADAVLHALSTLLDPDRPPHPVLGGLWDALRLDVEQLSVEAAEQAATARRQLDVARTGGSA